MNTEEETTVNEQVNLSNADHEVILGDALTLLENPEKASDVKAQLEGLPNSRVATLLESLPVEYRVVVFGLVENERLWPIAKELHPETSKHLIRSCSEEVKSAIQSVITSEEIRAYAGSLPSSLVDAILMDQDEATLKHLQEALSYEDTQVGRHLNKDILRVRPTISVASLSNRVRRRKVVHGIYVVNEDNELLGHISAESNLEASDERPVSELMRPVVAFEHDAQFNEILKMVHPDDEVAWYPVLNDGALVGCFPVSAILWELQDSILSTTVTESPSTEEDLFTPIPKAAKLRAFWLVINLATAFMASAVIGMFEGTLQQVVALAILMPVVASMGGIAGSQTLAVALRGIALKHISSANLDLLLKKESKIAAVNGAIIGLLIAGVVAWWFDSILLGLVIFVAILINSLAAASSGTLIPFLLNKMNIDPAISGAVILTTVTDIVGFLVFLGLGSILLIG